MDCHDRKNDESLKDGLPNILLVGNPNVGKSVIFGYLTGRYVTVSNYPGTTVEVSRGKANLDNKTYFVVDTPGVNSLMPTSEDEEATRNILLNEKSFGIINVADTKNLKRSLLISIQLAEMGLPFQLILNLFDEAESRGITVDIERLSALLGVEVLATVATRKQGMDKLVAGARHPKKSTFQMKYSADIEEGISKISVLLPDANISSRSLALMLLAGDRTLTEWLHKNVSEKEIETIENIRRDLSASYKKSLGYVINRQRMAEVEKIANKVYGSAKLAKSGFSNTLGNLMMHPIWGVPVLIVTLYLMYLFVGDFGAGTLVDLLENEFFGQFVSPWSIKLVKEVIPFEIVQDLFVGEYGLITMALSYAVAIVFPIVGTFFIAFSILEDSGYLPRLAVMVNKIFRLMSLNGKAVLPMVLGLGCDTMATLTTRILDSKKDRMIVTLLLAMGVPCSAQLGVILGMLGGVSFYALVIWSGIILLVLFLVGYLASKVMPGDPSDFIYELPPIRVPQFKNIFFKTIARVDWYMREAVPLFILGTFVLFTLDKLNVLTVIEDLASPVVVGLLDLPPKAAEAFLIGFLRRDYGAAGLYALQKSGMMDNVQTLVSIVTMTLFIPCIANFFMIIKERGMKTAVWMTVFILPFALFVGGIVNFLLRAFGVRL